MQKPAKVIGLIVFLTVVLAAGTLSARKPIAAPPPDAVRNAALPDLVIEKIYVTKDCLVAVVVKNLGPGPVPDEVWTVHHPKSAGVYLYKNGAGWGGASIWLFDPAKKLKNPGGTATYTSTLLVSEPVAIKAVVDFWNVVAEVNEGSKNTYLKNVNPDCDVRKGLK